MPNVPLRRFSIRDRGGRGDGVGSRHVGAVVAKTPSAAPSVWALSFGVADEFSSPGGSDAEREGIAFPWSVETLRTRFAGLLGEVRVRRMAGRDIFALGGYGDASGDCCELEKSTKFPWLGFRDGERGEETYGVVLDGDWLREARREKFEGLDGERDSDRRNCLMAEPAST